jgi:hypothetical protein
LVGLIVSTKDEVRHAEETHKLIDRLLYTLTPSIDDITSVVLPISIHHVRQTLVKKKRKKAYFRGLEQILHETTETGKVGGDIGNTHDGTLSGSVSEWLI